MAGIKPSNIRSDARLVTVASTIANFLKKSEKTSADEGDIYYDTTLNYLRTYNGSTWSPAGMSGIGPGSLDSAAQIGAKITNAIAIEIESTNPASNLLILDSNGTGTADVFDISQAGGATHLINLTQGGTGMDIDGTSSAWTVTKAGVGTFGGLGLGDSVNLSFGDSGDVTIDYVDGGTPGTAGAGLLVAHTVSDDNIQFGNATYSFDVIFIGETATTNFMQWDLNGGADSVGALIFDNADIDLGDSDLIRLGDSADVTIGYLDSGDNLAITHGGKVSFGTDGTGMDIYFYAATAGNYLYWDETNAILDVLDVKIDLDDDAILRFGSSNDIALEYDGATDQLRVTGSGKTIALGAQGAGLDMYWYGNVSGDYIYWDEDNARMDLNDIDLRFDDNARLYFGSDADVYFVWDNTNSELDFVGNLNITGNFSVSGAFDIGNFSFGDDEELRFGNSDDFVFKYDSSNANMEIDAAAANDQITFGTTVATDVRIDGATYDIHWDASEDTLCFLDSSVLGFGNTAATPDIEISWDATRLNITGSGEEIRIGASTAGLDVRFYSDTAGNFMLWDMDANTNGGLVLEDATITMMDDTNLLFGDGASGVAGDFKMYSDGTDLFIQEVAAVAGLILKLGESGKGLEVQFYGDNAGKDMLWDQDEDALTFEDTTYIKLGTGNDLLMSATTTTATFKLAAGSDLQILDTDNASSKVTFGITSGTNGLDILINSATAGDNITFDAQGKTLTFTDCSSVFGYDNNTVAYTTVVDSGDHLTLSATDSADAKLYLGTASGTNSMDVWFLTPTSGEDIIFDAAGKTLTFDNVDVILGDADSIQLGDGTDLTISATTTTTTMLLAAASDLKISDTDNIASKVTFGVTGGSHGLDVWFNTVTSGEDIIFDAAGKTLTFDNVDIILQDSDLIAFGDSSAEGTIGSDATDMVITTGTNKNVIVTGGALLGEQETLTAATPTLKSHGATNIDSTSNAVDGTLGSPDKTTAAVGQIKVIVMTEASNSSTVSITNHETSDPEVATFNAIDETGVFMWTGTEWITIFATCTFV